MIDDVLVPHDAERMDWTRRDILARNYLVATIESQQQRSLINCRTAHEMWTRLSAQHLRNAVENQHVLQQKFFEYQYQPEHDIMAHITEVETMASMLSDVEAPVSEIQIMTKILCTMPPSYRSFTTAWDSVPAHEKTIALLTSRLLKEETMAKRWTRGQKDTNDAAFFAHNFPTITPNGARGNRTDGGRGGRGNRRGYYRRRPESSRQHPYNPTFCSYCGLGPHKAIHCRGRLKDEADAKSRDAAAAASDKKKAISPEDNSEFSFLSEFTCFTAHSINDWYADSGATQHMSGQRSLFRNFVPVKPNTWFVNGIGGARLQVLGHGQIVFKAKVNGSEHSVSVSMVLYVPNIGTNLLSIAAVTEVRITVHFIESFVKFNRNDQTVIVGERIGRNLYHLAITATKPVETAYFMTPAAPSLAVWHQRFAHVSCRKIAKMAAQHLVNGLTIQANSAIPSHPCPGCMAGKMERSPFPTGRTRAVQIGQLIHSDVCGPMHVETPGGAKFFVMFTDDYSGFRAVYFLKYKSEVADCFKDYAEHLHTETKQKIHTLRTDNGGEYTGHSFRAWLSEQGIRYETSAPHTPEQNGVSERANRTIVEGARSLLHAKHLPLELWGEAISCAVYVLNRVTSKAAPNTPFQNWYGTKPDVSNLRIFGSTAYIHVPKIERRKLDSKSLRCYFVGYSDSQKAYRFWDPISRKIKTSRDVIFDEQIFYTPAPTPTQLNEDPFNHLILHPLIPADESINHQLSAPLEVAQVEEDVAAPPVDVDNGQEIPPVSVSIPDNLPNPRPDRERISPYPLRVREPRRRWEESMQSTSYVPEPDEPRNLNDALKSPDAALWKLAADDEYNSLMDNKTWTLTTLPPDREAIQSRWVLTVKPGVRGATPRYKARLVAKGYSQRPGIDYDETFAPVAKQTTLRTVLSFVAALNLEMCQLDIKTAFLYGELNEEIYLKQPEGYISVESKNLVCRLHKCLYGLKQASRVWNQHFDNFLKLFGLTPSESDPCLYLRISGNEFTAVTIWVDDGLVCSNSSDVITKIISHLKEHFEMRSSEANHFVGLSITRNREEKTLYISQPDYIKKILRRFHMDQCNPVDLPATPGVFFTRDNKNEGSIQVPFREAVGSLLYLMLSSRPDISFSVNQVSQFCEKPQNCHWAAVKKILAYLKRTSEHGIRFGPELTSLLGFTDADFAGDTDTRRSTSGYVFLLNGGPIAWSSRRQKCVTLSTTEAEYVAACEAAREGVWLKRLLNELMPNWSEPIPLMCDNMSSIDLSKNPRFHQLTKHIHVRYHFIRLAQEEKEIDVRHIPSKQQLADSFTKPLANPRFTDLRNAISVVSVPIA